MWNGARYMCFYIAINCVPVQCLEGLALYLHEEKVALYMFAGTSLNKVHLTVHIYGLAPYMCSHVGCPQDGQCPESWP